MFGMVAKKATQVATFEEFVREKYAPWVNSHHKRPKETLRLLELFFPYFGNRKLADIDAWAIERYRSARLKEVKPISVNHDFTALRAALNRAIFWGLLKEHPMKNIKQSKIDGDAKIRYLSSEETQRLREALPPMRMRFPHLLKHFLCWNATIQGRQPGIHLTKFYPYLH